MDRARQKNLGIQEMRDAVPVTCISTRGARAETELPDWDEIGSASGLARRRRQPGQSTL